MGTLFGFWLILFASFPVVASAAEGDMITAAPTSWATVALAAISAIGGIVTFLKARQVHAGLEETKALVLKIELSINSRMDDLLAVTRSAAEMQGAADEKARQLIVSTLVDAGVAKRESTAPQQSEPSATARPKNKKDL